MQKSKRVDAVKMMRAIRDTLQKEINEGRLNGKKELKRIRQKYGFNCQEYLLSMAENKKSYKAD